VHGEFWVTGGGRREDGMIVLWWWFLADRLSPIENIILES